MGSFTPEQREKAAETRRQNAAAKAIAVVPAVAPTETPAADSAPAAASMESILALLQDLTGQMGKLEKRVDQQQQSTPRMVPMQGTVPDRRSATSGLAGGESRELGAQLPVGARGLQLDPMVFRAFPQQFDTGQPVRINPDAHREGWPEGVTWASVLEKFSSYRCQTKVGKATCHTVVKTNEPCPRCGASAIVKGVRYLSKSGEWKYMVQVPGITQRGTLGDGFLQNELLAA